MEVYEDQGVVFFGIEKGIRWSSFTGNVTDPIDFVIKLGWTFLNGIDQDQAIFAAYGADMSQFMVIGKNGRMAYVSPIVGFEEGAIDVATIAAAIEQALDAPPVPVPVRHTTWSRIKLLWRR